MDAAYLFAHNFYDVRYENLPKDVVEITKKLILDQLGVALAGSSKPGIGELLELFTEWDGKGEATTLCYGFKIPAIHAAQLNATMGHAADYDDTHEDAMMHPSVVNVPTGLAMAEYTGGLSGREFITAVTLGIDMMCRLGLATRPGTNLMTTGWHFTTLYGFMAAAGVAGRILGLDENGLVNAFGIGYHQGSGNGQSVLDGAQTKRMGPGFAVRGGIAAALMAKKGITGSRNSLEGEFGVFNVYHQGNYDPAILTTDLGKRFEAVNVSIKPYPCCRAIHPFIDATLAIVNERNLKPDDIQEITAICHEGSYRVLGVPLEIKCNPPNPIDAQFSIPWSVATIISRGKATLEHYTESAIRSSDILDIANKIKVELDPNPGTAHVVDPGQIKIRTKSGELYYKQIDDALGSPSRPLTFDQCADKVKDCASYAIKKISDENINKVIDLAGRLEQVDDVREIVHLLT
jgi:2-methylcitrate dehydratase PrpD